MPKYVIHKWPKLLPEEKLARAKAEVAAISPEIAVRIGVVFDTGEEFTWLERESKGGYQDEIDENRNAVVLVDECFV